MPGNETDMAFHKAYSLTGKTSKQIITTCDQSYEWNKPGLMIKKSKGAET